MLLLHTHALELFFEISHVFAVGNAEVVVRVIGLGDAVGRRGGAEGQDGGGSMGTLSVADFLHGHHFYWLGLIIIVMVW